MHFSKKGKKPGIINGEILVANKDGAGYKLEYFGPCSQYMAAYSENLRGN